MRHWVVRPIVGLTAALALAPLLLAFGQNAAPRQQAAPQPFDPHDLSGTWRGDTIRGIRNFGSLDQKIPEPPLTEWGKRNLLMKSISHDALGGKRIPGSDRPGHDCPNNQDPCFSEDPNGVKANDPNGEYPAKDCEPLAAPAIYDYPGIGSMELLTTRAGDRIFQFFEYHREWRTFWLNKDHPKDVDLTYEGDSVARWDGNILIVDTIGFNGKTQITQNVGHWKSDAFHLIERFARVDHDHLQIEMTYSDPKAWGDKSWPGFKKYFKLVPTEDFQEFICSPREYKAYEAKVTQPFNSSEKR